MRKKLFGLSVGIALAALVGCSTPMRPVPSVSSTSMQRDGERDAHKKKPFEILKARSVAVTVVSCVSGSGEATFTAKGKAKGHYRGKFPLSGAWNFVNASGQSFWTFAETFKISGHHPITGSIEGTGSDAIATCKTFGPVKGGKDLTYELGTKKGAPTISLIKNGAALLQQLR